MGHERWASRRSRGAGPREARASRSYYAYLTGAVLNLYLLSLPVAVAGFVLGITLRRLLAAERLFRPVVLGLLALNGAALVVRGLAG